MYVPGAQWHANVSRLLSSGFSDRLCLRSLLRDIKSFLAIAARQIELGCHNIQRKPR
jgi:hypothetical protein